MNTVSFKIYGSTPDSTSITGARLHISSYNDVLIGQFGTIKVEELKIQATSISIISSTLIQSKSVSNCTLSFFYDYCTASIDDGILFPYWFSASTFFIST